MQPHRFLRHMDAPPCFKEDLAEALRSYDSSVPDIIMIDFWGPDGQWTFTIVELKYCRDTDPTPQQTRAAEQHAALKELIMAHEPKATVHIVPLMLGASGVIYESFMSEMRNLGVNGSALTSLARRLHFIAVNNLKLIWQQRCAIVMGNGQRPRTKRNRGQRRKSQHKQKKPNCRISSKSIAKGVKRPHTAHEPDHRKRRKKR
jgi:hypothetical protein